MDKNYLRHSNQNEIGTPDIKKRYTHNMHREVGSQLERRKKRCKEEITKETGPKDRLYAMLPLWR